MGTIWYNGINGDSCTTRKRMETDPRWWIFSRFRSIHEFSTTSLGAESPTSFGFSVHRNWSTPAGGADASQLKFAMRRGWIKQNLDLQLRHSRTAFERCLYWGQEVHTSSTTTSKRSIQNDSNIQTSFKIYNPISSRIHPKTIQVQYPKTLLSVPWVPFEHLSVDESAPWRGAWLRLLSCRCCRTWHWVSLGPVWCNNRAIPGLRNLQ